MHNIKKNDTFWLVLNCAITLDFERGHQRWTISDLSRKSRVTRSLIYYYLGKSRSQILIEAIKLIGNEIFGFHEREQNMWREGKITESIIAASEIINKYPHLGAFYFTHRLRSSEIGRLIQSMEKEYLNKLRIFFPDAEQGHLMALFAMFVGFTLIPNIKQESMQLLVESALRKLRRIRTNQFISESKIKMQMD